VATHARHHGRWASWKGQGLEGGEWVCGCTTHSKGLTRRGSAWPSRDDYANSVLGGDEFCAGCIRVQRMPYASALGHKWPLCLMAKAYSGRAHTLPFEPDPIPPEP